MGRACSLAEYGLRLISFFSVHSIGYLRLNHDDLWLVGKKGPIVGVSFPWSSFVGFRSSGFLLLWGFARLKECSGVCNLMGIDVSRQLYTTRIYLTKVFFWRCHRPHCYTPCPFPAAFASLSAP